LALRGEVLEWRERKRREMDRGFLIQWREKREREKIDRERRGRDS
jgi:hypothetical protein